jgi:anaerobic ribonucleoside-triphosphate reductase
MGQTENNSNGKGSNGHKNGRKIIFPVAVRKRDGSLVDFDLEKQTDAIYSAAESVEGRDREESKRVVEEAIRILNERKIKIPTSDDIDSANYEALKRCEHHTTAHMYKVYGDKRRKIRELKTRGESAKGNATDAFLMVASATEENAKPWDRDRIVYSLVEEAGLPPTIATKISKIIENNLGLSGFKVVSTSLIREIAHEEMLKRGLNEAADKYRTFGIPRSDLEAIIHSKGKENSNISGNNPEAVNYTIAGKTLKEYALSGGVFTTEVAAAHTNGEIHIHNLEAPTRVYCSSHSLEYIKEYGLKLLNLTSASSPAQHAKTLTGHLNTYLASMQAYYAGALGIGYMNIFYAPLIEHDLEEEGLKSIKFAKRKVIADFKEKALKASPEARKDLERIIQEEEVELARLEEDPQMALIEEEVAGFIKQEEQYKEYSASQNAFSRGGQTLFLDFNMHTGVPSYLRDTLARGPGGKCMMFRGKKRIYLEQKDLPERTPSGYYLKEWTDPETNRVIVKERLEEKNGVVNVIQETFIEEGERVVTYKDYDALSKKILKAGMKIFRKGDSRGAPFPFPKFDLHVNEDTFKDPEQVELLKEACVIASENGSPYFIFDRDEVTLSACCRLRTAVEDNYVLKHPESMRFCGFLNVTLNLPQAAYRAKRNGKDGLEGILEELDKSMDVAVKAHLQKREYIKNLQKPGEPQWQTGMPSADGLPYVDVDKATYIIGMIGLNDMIHYAFGKELHELSADEFENYALRTIAHINLKAKEYGRQYGLKFSLEETPAESASRRLAKVDLERYPEAKGIVKGGNEPYYTNSIHYTPDAPIDLITRIEGQSKFHPAIESGAIIHSFIGEQKPSPESIFNLVKKTFYNTQAAQLTISPEFTICKICGKTHRGLVDKCPECGHSEMTICKCGHNHYGPIDKCPLCGNFDKETLFILKTIQHMTRIVGYYSIIEEWNPSKLSELSDRHKGQYGFASTGAVHSVEMPTLKNNNGHVEAIQIGKEGCHICDNTYGSLERISKKMEKEYGTGLTIRMYKTDNEEGLVKLMVAGVNPSRLPAVVLIGHNNEVLGKFETTYKDGKADMVTAGKLLPVIEEYMTRRKQ